MYKKFVGRLSGGILVSILNATDCNLALNLFISIFGYHFEECFPLKKVHTSGSRSGWLALMLLDFSRYVSFLGDMMSRQHPVSLSF